METTTFQFTLGPQTLRATVDKNDSPAVYQDQQRFTDFPALLAALPSLMEADSLPAYCRLALLFAGGSAYRFISDPLAFRDGYRRRNSTDALQSSVDGGWGNRSSDFGPFDLETLPGPRISENTVSFMAEEEYFGTPYAVTVPYPWTDVASPARFELIPAPVAEAFA